jgi:hypothetical protein
MGQELLFAYGGYGPWSNQLQRRVSGAPAPLERDFLAHSALFCLASHCRLLLTPPSDRLSGTPYVAAAASDGIPVPAHIPATAPAGGGAAARPCTTLTRRRAMHGS